MMLDNDFELLKKQGLLGFFNSCEITTVFLRDKKKNKTFNFYTIVTFEENYSLAKGTTFLTNKPVAITQNLSVGIVQYNSDLQQMTNMFYDLLENKNWEYQGEKLELGNLIKVPKQFIKKDGTVNVPINSILKNNYYNGSYIVEFFDIEKGHIIDSLSRKDINKICEIVKSKVPIDLNFLNDRIGNIIFQFPSNLLELNITSNDQWDGLNVKLVWENRVQNKSNFMLQVMDEYDEIITSYGNQIGLSNNEYKIKTGNSNFINSINIINIKDDIILSSFAVSFVKNLNITMNTSNRYTEKRTLKRFDKQEEGEIEELEIVSSSSNPGKKDLTYVDWIQQRKYDNEKDELERRLEFVQYGKKSNDRIKALNDIRTLINRHCAEGVYLWDPYLTHSDIMDTLYFCKIRGIEMKAITSFDKKRKRIYKNDIDITHQNLDINEWYKIQRNGFEFNSNNLGINLEFRCQHGTYGWKFHDRFLIFPSSNNRPKVWSLGISVNGLGKEHHILQAVSNPQNIIDSFLELWGNLNSEDCVIWRSQ